LIITRTLISHHNEIRINRILLRTIFVANKGFDTLSAHHKTGRLEMKRILIIAVVLVALVGSQPVSATTGTMTLLVNTTLTEDHAGNIVVAADHITLDCGGHTVTGTGSGIGILLQGRTGIAVKNCHVAGFTNGFVINGSSFNHLVGNTSTDNSERGFFTTFSNDNILTRNTARSNNTVGFVLNHSTDNTLERNKSIDNSLGFNTRFSSGNLLVKNQAEKNLTRGFLLFNASANTLELNRARDNALEGFFVVTESFPGSAGDNIFTRNKSQKNDDLGFRDDSLGTGTTGTGNIYTNNKCIANSAGGSAPDGLCSPQ
jgi:parallel beta-helix repeat protein